jgi:hypothetical protein
MNQFNALKFRRNTVRGALIFVAGLISFVTFTGCLVVGYTSRGGWFIWPGSITLLIIIALIIWLLRR